ncbi:uncharacterized protein LOC136093146 [Hydra vulgaris]|uniref:uncharacterized protein LOC136093146 n=1 Tax=Hydra vulgaris TaxID=6087 RepID=UPI0032EA0194
MNLDFLKQDNWPKLGAGSHSQSTKDIHNWCSQLSHAFLELFERLQKLETTKIENDSDIQNLKKEIIKAANSSKSICDWSLIVKQGKQKKKPTEQLLATNVAINELEERKRGQKIRLRSKTDKPGPILVKLTEDFLCNKILGSAKKLRSNELHKSCYLSPDLTEVQRLQDFNLRTERNKMYQARTDNDPFCWANGCVDVIDVISNENGIEHKFLDILNENFFYQHINIPTFQLSDDQLINTLDLVFTTQSASVSLINSKFVLGNIKRGHLIIRFDFILADKAVSDYKSKQRFMFAKSKFDKISDLISNDWIRCFSNKNVQEMFDELIYYTEVACNHFTPTKMTINSLKIRPAWVNASLKFLIRSKQNLRYKNCSCKWKDPVLKFEYKMQRAVRDSIKAFKGTDGETTQNSKYVADILNKNFQAAIKREDDGPLPYFQIRTNETFIMTTEDFKYEDVFLRLKNLKENKSSGVDNLHSAILKNCASTFAIPLTYIFKKSFETSKLPEQFRSANITPLYKKGEKTLAVNYRPISLTSIACKIMEGIMRCKLIVKQQYGFVKSKSCTTNLLDILDFISTSLENGKPVDVIFLDFARTFDTVPHNRLLLKLAAYKISGLTIKWIEAFLKNRKQRVVLGENVSSWAEIISGVPQGSVIGPLLFVLFINYFPETLKNISMLYADDAKIMNEMISYKSTVSLQADLDRALKWTQE